MINAREEGRKKESSKHILKTFYSLPHSFFCIVNLEGKFEEFNPYFAKALGYSARELKEKGLLNILHPDDVAGTRQEMKKLARADEKFVMDFENRCRHKDGDYRVLTWCSCYDQQTERMYAIGRDVTEEKRRRKKLARLLETKDKLFSILAHDLRGTLQGIKTMADLLQLDVDELDIREHPKTESLLDGLRLISRTSHTTNELLDNQLNWFFMQLDTFKPSFGNLDLVRCIHNAIDIYMSMATNKGIDLEFAAPKEKVQVRGDWNMLSIVFRNLISNAIKFSYSGSEIQIGIETGGDTVDVRVRDYGIGIPREIRDKLFNMNERPRRQGTHQEQSTGLGLLLCKEIVMKHNGEITAESPGKGQSGTVFHIRLPGPGAV